MNSADHTISTFAGNGSSQFSGDGLNANLAGLYKPYSVYLDGAGNLLLADRLDAAGFASITVDTNEYAVRFQVAKPLNSA